MNGPLILEGLPADVCLAAAEDRLRAAFGTIGELGATYTRARNGVVVTASLLHVGDLILTEWGLERIARVAGSDGTVEVETENGLRRFSWDATVRKVAPRGGES